MRTVLLGEHEQKLTEIITYLLSAWGYKVISAQDGHTVLDIVRREHPDAILLDANLPGIDGLSISKTLKEDFLTAHIPLIVIIDKRQIRKKILEIEQGVDDYIADPPDPIDLEIRLEMAMRRTAHQLQANALTRLPGNRQIEKVIKTKFEKGATFSVAYYDIDNFKSFNDKYGYMKGDAVIRHTAYIISTIVKKFGNKDDFVGHIGGDDFVVVTTPDREKLIASESILNFNRLIPFHYNAIDREKGCITVEDRRGNLTEVPLMSISIAIVNNRECNIENMVMLMETIVEIKCYLKTLPGSNFLANRRGSLKKEPLPALPVNEVAQKKANANHQNRRFDAYRPLGQILLDSSVINAQQLDTALSKHWSTGRRIGQSIVDLGMASSGDIARALEYQLNVPHFDPRGFENKNGELEELLKRIPADFMKERGVIPVNKEKNIVSLAMIDPRDIIAINKIKNITGCSVMRFFILENEFTEMWSRVIRKADKGT